MKTYQLMIAQQFPVGHPKRGEPTHFIDKIRSGEKIHTIRANYPLWKKRFDEINAGRACLSLRIWTGQPRKSPQEEIFRFDKSHGIGIERLEFTDSQFNMMTVNGQYCFANIETSIAKHDGLSFVDFRDWFKQYDLSEPLAIIHFTDFRYDKGVGE